MGPFQGYFQVLSWKNGEDIQITFQFSIAEQTQFWTAHRPALTHTHRTHTLVLPSLTQTSESSAFQLPAISSIFSQQTGSHYQHLAVISH